MLSQRTVEKHVAEALAKDERWRVVVRGSAWVCPFCLRIGARDLRMDDAVDEKLAQHFLRDCPAWSYFEAEPHPVDDVRKTARLLVFKGRVLRWLVEEPRFQVHGEDRRWLCPYCLLATDARVPPRPLDDPEAWGPAPEEDPFLGQVVAHLVGCRGFAQGEDRLRPYAELEQALARHERARATSGREPRGPSARAEAAPALAGALTASPGPRGRREPAGEDPAAARARFEREPSFQLVDQERRWLCPFCARAPGARLPGGRPDEAFFADVARHLGACEERRTRGDRPRPERELRAVVEAAARARKLAKVRQKIERHAVWRTRDLEGRWRCPYCASRTDALFPERDAGGRRDDAAMERLCEGVQEHLAACAAYRRPGAQVLSREELARRAGVAPGDARLRRLAAALHEDPRWTVTDAFGSWLCPFCRRVQRHIAPGAGGGALLDKTAEQVDAHLVRACDAYVDGAEPLASRADLEEVVRRLATKSSGPRESGVRVLATPEVRALDSLDEQSWRRIRADLDAVRTRVERAKEREVSLREARHKQLRLLPDAPDVPGLDLARVYRPCEAVGGDFYAFFRATEAAWGVAVGDVAGHGIEAAMLMGPAKKLIEVHGRGGTSTARALALANRDLFGDLDDRTFVTAFLGVVDMERRVLTFSRAGHGPLVLYNPRRAPPLSVLDSKGLALGMDEGPMFEQTIEELEVPLLPGDLFVQYTDGATEAMNPAGEQFGLDRLLAVVEAHGRHEAEYVLWKLERAIEAFRAGRPRGDDMTLIAFKVLA